MPGQLDTFRAERQRIGATTAQVAAKLGVAEASVIGYEDGSIPCSAQNAAAYRRAVIELGGKFGQPNDSEFSCAAVRARAEPRLPRNVEPLQANPPLPPAVQTHGGRTLGGQGGESGWRPLGAERGSAFSTQSGTERAGIEGDTTVRARACQGRHRRAVGDDGRGAGGGPDVGRRNDSQRARAKADDEVPRPPLMNANAEPSRRAGAEGPHLHTGNLPLIPPIADHHSRVALMAERDTNHEGTW